VFRIHRILLRCVYSDQDIKGDDGRFSLDIEHFRLTVPSNPPLLNCMIYNNSSLSDQGASLKNNYILIDFENVWSIPMNKPPENRASTLPLTFLVSMILAIAGCDSVEKADSQFKPQLLERMDAEFAGGQHRYIDGLLVLHHGKVVMESRYNQDYVTPFEKIDSDPEEAKDWGFGKGDYYYVDPKWHPWLKGGELHTLQSVTKSVSSALIGIAILRGEIDSVDMPVAPLLDSPAPFDGDPRAKQLTLRHILTMTTGVAWNETNYELEGNDGSLLEAAPNWQQYVLSKPFSDDPGTTFNYNSGTSLLLDVVLLKTTGMHAAEYAKAYLFDPLGIESFYWKTSPDGLSDTLGGLFLTAQDLARIGTLYANDGVWNGTRLLPKGWVQASFSPAISIGLGPDWTGESHPGAMYGYLWWLLPDPDQAGKFVPVARGYGGQRLVILPDDDVIAILYGWNIMDGTYEYSDSDFIRHLVRAFR
jgi:CubicO group peptidase (beta-lactamase class C family)